MRRRLLLAGLICLSLALGACASGGGADEGAAAEQPQTAVPPPPGSPLAKIELGMNDTDVRRILGQPTDANAYQTGKSWIPFYYGTDTSRTDWIYRGVGRVVFSRNQYSGGLKVIRVDYNPDEGS